MNIPDIPDEELRTDLQDSYDDISLCEAALKLGLKSYPVSIDLTASLAEPETFTPENPNFKVLSIQERLDGNKRIVKVILAEIARRDKLTKEQKNARP